VFGEHAPNDILVDLDPEDPSDLLGDAHAAEVRIATFQRDDGGDEFRGRALWAGFAARQGRGGEEPAVLGLYQCRVELEQCRRPDQSAKLWEPLRAHEQRGEAEDEAIDGREIGRPLPGAIADEQLLLEQQGLSGDGADAPGRRSLARVTSRWMARMTTSRTVRTVSSPPVRARLHGARGLRHTANSPPTGIRQWKPASSRKAFLSVRG